MNDYFNNLMNDPMFNMGLSLMSQWKTPYGVQGSLGGAMEHYNRWQDNQYTSQLRKMQMDKIKREQEREQKTAEWEGGLSGVMEKAKPSIAPYQADNPFNEDLGNLQTVNPGDPQALQQYLMKPESPYFGKMLENQLEQGAREQEAQIKSRAWNEYVNSLPPEVLSEPYVAAVIKGGPEMAKAVLPNILPKLMNKTEQKGFEGADSRSKFKTFPGMSPEQAQTLGLDWSETHGGIARSPLDKPVSVTVGVPRGAGKPPVGYRFKEDGELEPIPGGPKDVSKKDAVRTQKNLDKAANVISAADTALEQAGFATTGVLGDIRRTAIGRLTGSGAYDLGKTVATIKANIGFDELQAMRDASPTGGALGQVAIQELDMLQSTIANLDPGQSEEQLVANLANVKKHYENWKSAVERAGTQASTVIAPKSPPKIGEVRKATDGTPYYFKGGNPADPKSWSKVKP